MKFTTSTEPAEQFAGLSTTIPKGDDDATIAHRAERFRARIEELTRRTAAGWAHAGTVQIDNPSTVVIYDTFTTATSSR